MDVSNGHQEPRDDEPLFVPDEFEAAHLKQARRAVASTTGARGLGRRLTSSLAGRHTGSAQQRVTRLLWIVHGIAVIVTLALSAVTDTWLIGLAVSALIGLSLLTATRLVHVVERVHAHESAQRRHPQRRSR